MFYNGRVKKKAGYDIRAAAHDTAFPGLGGGVRRDQERTKLDYKYCLCSLRRNPAREVGIDAQPREAGVCENRIVPQFPVVAKRLKVSQRSHNCPPELVVLLKYVQKFFDTPPFKS